MEIKFKKMHGTGNDFIVIKYEDFPFEKRFSELAKKVCHRHFGVGADGLLVVGISSKADFKMQYFNSDGSLAAMCGNGIRCFSKFVYDEHLIRNTSFTIETLSGIKSVNITPENGKAKMVRVNMGQMILDPTQIPVITDSPSFINKTIEVAGRKFVVSSVLMGVPHTIIFSDSLDLEEVIKYGPLIEKHNLYPQNTNVNFALVENRNNIKVRTWERGAGYTLACGTGVTSVVGVASMLNLVEKHVNIHIEGGDIKIEVSEDENIFMEGPAVDVCTGLYFTEG